MNGTGSRHRHSSSLEAGEDASLSMIAGSFLNQEIRTTNQQQCVFLAKFLAAKDAKLACDFIYRGG